MSATRSLTASPRLAARMGAVFTVTEKFGKKAGFCDAPDCAQIVTALFLLSTSGQSGMLSRTEISNRIQLRSAINLTCLTLSFRIFLVLNVNAPVPVMIDGIHDQGRDRGPAAPSRPSTRRAATTFAVRAFWLGSCEAGANIYLRSQAFRPHRGLSLDYPSS
jgi:hypothetical protein